MAGESPDKSEQRKSPGGKAPAGRDPRLAAFGDAPSSDGDGKAGAKPVTVDQPTAVFKAFTPPKDADKPDESHETPANSEGKPSVPAAAAPVDQPTAVFSAVQRRPERQGAVDQPTAVFKAVVPKSGAGASTGVADKTDEAEKADKAGKVDEDGKAGKAEKAAPKWATATDTDEAESTSEPDADAEAGAEADSDSDSDSAEVAEAEAEPNAEEKVEAEPEVDAKAESESKPEPKAEAKPETGAKPQPKSATQEKAAPAAEPKPKPEPVSSDSDSNAGPESDSGSDSERTSTFVPLRADDVRPAARTTVPAPAPAPASAAVTAPAPAVTPPSLTEAERTKQQPMPPRPPLDLLAELTNTPPPPETPVRTLVRRIKIWTPLVLLLAIIFATAQVLRPLPEPKLAMSVEATYTFEGGQLKMPWPNDGQGAVEVEGVGVIGTYGAQKPAPTASVAKTMTAYVILKNHPIKDMNGGPLIEVDQLTEEQSHNPDWSVAHVKKGQKFTEGQMLQMLMIPSANNVAHLLARWDAGTEEAFLKKMNDAAKDLGMTNTTYTDPSGFEKTTVSTPMDQLKLAKAVMQFKPFREIVNLPDLTLPGVPKMFNGNAILSEGGVGGIKTGSSTPAGGNLLWAAYTKIDGEYRRIVGIAMGAQNATTVREKLDLAVKTYSLGLIKAAQEGVTSATVVKKGDVVGYVDDGLGGRTPLVATQDLKPLGWAGLKVELKLTDGGKRVPGTAAEGTVVGELSVGSGGGKVSVPVALERNLEEPGFGAKLTRIA
ncbi:D-alanyl-D-alanine carboxypeptidase [Streptomyces coeruleoprunus]|uniref:D-alanyl-D-alanine carboxypeptidase n=1 Tax=Streptomyces coeruleoprunus TaxID=285563 RepID=A0ABV9XIH6_9ACTN